MFVSRSVLKKKLCANFSEKKNRTESNNLAPPPPEIKWCVLYFPCRPSTISMGAADVDED